MNNISLLQFKNYVQSSFNFEGRIVGICGNNGIGKTNLLDAIHYLCFTKSYFGKSDAANTLSGAMGFRVAAQVSLDGRQEEPVCILRETGRKEFLLNGEAYEKFSQHIGRYPCVLITPDDIQMITGGSEERRRFIDTLLCQLDAVYLQQLMDYNRVLQQRNGYLKALAERTAADRQLLDVYDRQLTATGTYVFGQRKRWLEKMIPLINSFYQLVAGRDEDIGISYESSLLHTGIGDLLLQNRERDLLLQRTSQGIHRDDLGITLRGLPFKNIASQGQRKSLLFALKLAEFELLKEARGFPPLLLLDDVFEKLDAERMQNLLTWVCVDNDGQVFITDTHCERLAQALQTLQQPFQVIKL